MNERKVPNWNHYFMDIAHEVAKRSKDPSTQVGCVIVNQEHKPISFGYNGMVQSCYEEHMTWERPMKYELVIHAEMNAILFAKEDLFNAKLYCTHIPCVNCLKHVLQAGIREIYYKNDEIAARFSEISLKAMDKLLKATEAKLIKIH